MNKSDLQRDKTVTRAVHRLFWQGLTRARRYFWLTLLLHFPSFFLQHIFVPLQIGYGVQAIITRNFDEVPHYAAAILLATLAAQIIFAVACLLFNRQGAQGAGYVQSTIFANYLHKDHEFYTTNFVGALGSQAVRLREVFIDYNRLVLHDIPKVAVTIVASLVVVALHAPQLAVVMFICMAVVLSFNILASGYRLKYRRLVSQASSRLSGVLGDALSHGSTVKSYAQEGYEQQRLEAPTAAWRRAEIRSWDMFTPMHFTRQIMLAITMGILLLVSARLYEQGAISIAIITVVQLYIIRLVNTTFEISDMIKNYETIMSTAYQPVATMLVPVAVKDPARPKRLPAEAAPEIRFANVSYHYPEASVGHDAISGVTLTVKSGEKIGLIGYSGGGKTTLTKLLLRFMDVDSGTIKVGGLDICGIMQADLRSAIAYVPQEPLLFHRSIRDNIAYARPEAAQADIEAAAKTAYVDEFVRDLPRGYDTEVGERGVKLSGGQRQRVAIARALLKDAPILVLDEATSALDSQSEQYIQQALWKLMEGRTAIVIAHRLSTIQRLDHIVVMDQGRIVQTGTHSDLLKDKKGIYAGLWTHQSGGYLAET